MCAAFASATCQLLSSKVANVPVYDRTAQDDGTAARQGRIYMLLRNHKMTNPDGTERGIPCDKIKIGELSWTMLKSKLAFLLGDDQIVEYRLWLALVPQFMHGLPGSDDALKASCSIANDAREGDVVKDFLAVYRFKSPTDEQGPSGSGQTPLLHAAMVGNVKGAAGLIAQGADVHRKIRKFDMATGMDAGGTALHMAVAACPVRHVEMVAVLLRAGADANVSSKSGVTPLMAGVGFHSFSGAKAFLECATDILDLERGHNTNGDTALGFATYAGTHELCEVLIQAGASRSNVTSTGGTKLHAVCQNVATTRSMLDLIWNEGELSINALYKPRRTFWILVFTYFQRGVKLGLIAKSQFAMEMAHSAGSTPLHFAAMNGLIGVIVWLLEHGAHKPLRIRNDMGSTPLDIARIFGPYPSIEAKLGATMLNNDFDTQFAIRRGSLLRRQTNGSIAEPTEATNASQADETRPVEPATRESDARAGAERVPENEQGSGSGGDERGGDEDSAVAAAGSTHTVRTTARVGTARLRTTMGSGNVLSANDTIGETAFVLLSSGMDVRFDEQAARFDEHAAQLVGVNARLDSLQADNTRLQAQLHAKLDALLSAAHLPADD